MKKKKTIKRSENFLAALFKFFPSKLLAKKEKNNILIENYFR